MKTSALLSVVMWSFLLAGCTPNTGHSLSTNDSLEVDSSKDWIVTWTLEAPIVGRRIEKRISDAKLLYSIDSGAWLSAPLVVTKESDSRLRLVATIDRGKLTGHGQILCYPEYVFDGNLEGSHKKSDPRLVRILNGEQRRS
jgi:hypothetical protein